MIGWADVVALGQELPEVEESTSYGRPALKVRDSWLLVAPKALARAYVGKT
jgi:hypothetical protein